MKRSKKVKQDNILMVKVLAYVCLLVGSILIVESHQAVNKTYETDGSIVQILVPQANAQGTGFFIEYNNKTLLITAAHVCGSSATFALTKFGVHLVEYLEPTVDVCILSAPSDVHTLPVSFKKPSEGLEVNITGFPEGFKDIKREEGVIMERHTADVVFIKGVPFNECPKNAVDNFIFCMSYYNTIHATVKTRNGNSGGPVIANSGGYVIGLVSMKDTARNDDLLFIPMQDIKKVLDYVTKR